jgi:hypothetical protein
MSSDRYTAASQLAIWPETTLTTPAPARKLVRQGSSPSYRRSSSARPSMNHSMAISPTTVTKELTSPNRSSSDRKNDSASLASLSKAALW